MNYMPIIHYARTLKKAVEEGNRFATADFINEQVRVLEAAYLRCSNPLVGLKLQVAADDLADAIFMEKVS